VDPGRRSGRRARDRGPGRPWRARTSGVHGAWVPRARDVPSPASVPDCTLAP
jgi:hypothetical protein